MGKERSQAIEQIPLSHIVPGKNPREDLGDISGLAASISERGLLQPIRVKPGITGTFELLTGHRRYAAHRKLGLRTIAAIVVPDEKESDSAVDRLVENLQREDLRPIELAKGIEALSRGYNQTDDVIAKGLGKSASVVKQWRLLSRLPDEILSRIGTTASATTGNSVVTPRHLARVLPRIPDPTDSTPAQRKAGAAALADVQEFIAAFEEHGGINAHQADAVWSMVGRGETDIGQAVEIVAKDPDAYRYGKKTFTAIALPDPIDSGETLEEETYRFFRNLARQTRSIISQVSPAVVARLSRSRRLSLVQDWHQLLLEIQAIADLLDQDEALAPKRKKLSSPR